MILQKLNATVMTGLGDLLMNILEWGGGDSTTS